jgi:hypothetical protein
MHIDIISSWSLTKCLRLEIPTANPVSSITGMERFVPSPGWFIDSDIFGRSWTAQPSADIGDMSARTSQPLGKPVGASSAILAVGLAA